MPANAQKVIEILRAELHTVEERCDGYRNELRDAISDIIIAEQQHRVKGTNSTLR